MKVVDKLCWGGFFVCLSCIIYGHIYHKTLTGSMASFVGYVFGLPFLIYPLAVLANWSESRKQRRRNNSKHPSLKTIENPKASAQEQNKQQPASLMTSNSTPSQ